MADTIGSRIRAARKKLNMTQAKLSEQAFISESYLALIENDKRNPSTDVVCKLAEILGVSADHLLFGEIPKNKQSLFNEWSVLMEGRSEKEIEAAQNLVKAFFDNVKICK